MSDIQIIAGFLLLLSLGFALRNLHRQRQIKLAEAQAKEAADQVSYATGRDENQWRRAYSRM